MLRMDHSVAGCKLIEVKFPFDRHRSMPTAPNAACQQQLGQVGTEAGVDRTCPSASAIGLPQHGADGSA
jgi:hypothetical protein